MPAALLGMIALSSPAAAQADTTAQPVPSPVYEAREPVALTLTANFNLLRRDRQAEPPWRTAAVTVVDTAGAPVTLRIRVRARGIWRRNNCQMPPLRLDFVRASVVATPLSGVNRPKLVHFCQDQDRAEQYVLQELQLYRIYALLTPMSHRTRLVRVTYADSGTGRVRTTRFGFLLEEPQALAGRVGAREIDIKGAVSEDLDERTRVILGVFQYMIGNTDWSTSGLHNVELYGRDAVVYPVAYDFDYSGAVDAHYAVPPPQVPIRSVRERIYRGACGSEATFSSVFDAFRTNRAAIRELYADGIGRLIEPARTRRTLRYFDDFFAVLDDPAAAQREIIGRCAARQ